MIGIISYVKNVIKHVRLMSGVAKESSVRVGIWSFPVMKGC